MGSQVARPAPSATLRILPGDCHVVDYPDVELATTLGSCVAACVRDPVAGVGGMNHFMLPKSDNGLWGPDQASLRFGNFAMKQLIDSILARGGRRDRLEVKLFGGANLRGAGANIGWENARYAEAYIAAAGLTVAARHLYGSLPRLIRYMPMTGKAFMLELSDEED